MPQELTTAQKITFATTRIDTYKKGKYTGRGTSFFYSIKSGDTSNIVLFTNKHVIDDSDEIRFKMILRDAEGKPNYNNRCEFKITGLDVSKNVFLHSKGLDLCGIYIQNLIDELHNQKLKLFYANLEESDIPTAEEWQKYDAIESVIMVGYPKGLMDKAHNMPLVRQGITASWLKLDFDNEPKFLIDCTSIPGSSGSPVFVNTRQSKVDDESGTLYLDNIDYKFVGITETMYDRTQKEPVKEVASDGTIRERTDLYVEVSVDNNLGGVIKSTELFNIIDQVKQIYH